MKKTIFTLCMMISLLTLTACGSTNNHSNTEMITVKDVRGEVEIPKEAKRIVDLSGNSDILSILGYQVIGTANSDAYDYTKFPSYLKDTLKGAKILGYSKVQTFFRIILPQVIKRILPSVTNEVITLVKDTSLAFVVAVAEMFTIAKQIASAQTTMMPFVIAAVFYFIFNLLVAIVMDKIEKKLNYYR
jgi:hypothetical protein